MSQAEFKKARKRLEQVRQEIRWILAVLDDPEISLKEYKLNQQERQQLYQECQECLAEMQELSKRVHIHVESEIDMVGPVGIIQSSECQEYVALTQPYSSLYACIGYR